jgi:subtilisin family serine protease
MRINQLLFLFLFLCLGFFTTAQEAEPIDGCDPCQPLGFNIFENGDFEMGNIGFNSDLTYDPTGGCAFDSYTFFDIAANNCQGNNLADHTSETGNYMSVNLGLVDGGGTSNDGIVIWSKNTLLLENQQYSFSFWVYSESIFNDTEPTLEVNIGGNILGATTSLNDTPLSYGGWQEFCFNYISEEEGIQTISITASYPDISGTENTEFLLDDISLNPLYPDAILCELIVQYEPGTTQDRIDSIRSRFDITVQDSCVCGNIDLWLINQFPMVVNGDTIVDIEKLKLSSRDTADVQDVDYNYITQNHASRIAQTTTKPSKVYDNNNFVPNSDDSCAIVVAVIDTGIDENHAFFNNPQYYPDNLWSFSTPCPQDGNNGYNFYDNNNDPDDNGNNGHGTHVSGIIVKQFNDNFTSSKGWSLELMPIKAQNAEGRGTLFKIICSTLFAVDNGADVINMSFGYRGDSTAILYNAIEKGLLDNEVIVVASAGNDARNNDLYGHYPSNLSNENLIAVAADTLGENNMNSITPYSCFGANSVDISVFGSIESSIPPGVDTEDGAPDGFTFLQGTSMAAPQIAAAAAIGKAYMNSAIDIKEEILSAGNNINTSEGTIFSITGLSFDITTYTLSLTNEQNCSSNNPPSADLIANPSNGVSPLLVNFSGANSTDPDDDNLTYAWDFGNGITGAGVSVSHTYTNVGTYTATLTVSDGNGESNQASVNIEVTASQPCLSPTVFVATPQSNTSALVTWDAMPAATLYQVRYKIKGTSTWISTGTSNLQRVLNNLTSNKYYQYKMRSKCADNSWSDFTEIKEFYSSACATPTGVTSIYLDQNRMRLRWDDTPVSVNRIKYRAVGTSSWLFKNSVPSNNYVYITGLTANITYEYSVRARCNDGSWSAYTAKYFHTTAPAARANVSESTTPSNLFPNPVRGTLNVSLNLSSDDDLRIIIRDVLGKVILDETKPYGKGSQTEIINVKRLEKGYYFISIYRKNQVETLRFMKL